jgi:hypothetical protein
MFHIDRENNEAISLVKKTFSDLNLKERNHLQEWIDKNPDILGEQLLILQKEFSGFSETSERLDLLALDAHGDLVIIENKLDDSGKDVVWQALKYVSYCASLSKGDIKGIYAQYLRDKAPEREAETTILEFLGEADFEEIKLNSGDQRIILVAAKFRKEVTSTVMWLLDHNVNIKCIKVTPYQMNEQIFLDTEQVLPPPDTEELRIKFNIKKQEEYKTDEENIGRYGIRLKFWQQAIPQLLRFTNLFQNISPSKDNWISAASGFSGISYGCVVTHAYVRAELLIGKPNAEENLRIFNSLLVCKENIEQVFGSPLFWDSLDNRISCRISCQLDEVNIFNESDWHKMTEFFCEKIPLLHKALTNPLKAAMEKSK